MSPLRPLDCKSLEGRAVSLLWSRCLAQDLQLDGVESNGSLMWVNTSSSLAWLTLPSLGFFLPHEALLSALCGARPGPWHLQKNYISLTSARLVILDYMPMMPPNYICNLTPSQEIQVELSTANYFYCSLNSRTCICLELPNWVHTWFVFLYTSTSSYSQVLLMLLPMHSWLVYFFISCYRLQARLPPLLA